MNVLLKPSALILLALAACGDPLPEATPSPNPTPGSGGAPALAGNDHGAATDLGTVTVAGRQFGITLLGALEPGVEGAFAVRPPADTQPSALKTMNAYLWVESEDGTQLSAPAKGSVENHALHFHVTPRRSEKTPDRVVLRVRAGSTDARQSLPLAGRPQNRD